MKRLKKIGLWLLALLTVLIIGIAIFAHTLKPDYEGEKQLLGLSSKVDVHYDVYGIPHIYAQNETDALRSLGYVHAQDRLWQMELLRRIGKGGLSEVFGADLVSTDRFLLALGIDDASKRTVEKLDLGAEWVKLAQAYLDGVNAFVAEGPTPLEFYLTGLEKSKFELIDIHNILGYMSFSFAMAHKTDPLLTSIKDKLGEAYLKDLPMEVSPNTTWIKNHASQPLDSVQTHLTSSVMQSLQALGIPLFEGSNGWVLAPEKTRNGKVLFANDPHIGFSQPSVWYEAHIHTPSYEKYGYHLAGVPFPLLAHDRSLAYGLTMFENDDVDFFYEHAHPTDSTKYRHGTNWVSYEYVTKEIKVKDAETIDFTYKNTVRGPILNGIADQIQSKRPVSMWWMYTQEENKVLDAIYGMCHATDIKEFQQALPNIHAPGLNVMYGDAAGNIAWWATGKLYHIPDSVNTKMIQESDHPFSNGKKYMGFSENPHAANPPWNYVYSANNQPDSIAGMRYPGYYLPENRAKRIVSLLEPRNDWDREGVEAMMVDVTSPVNTMVVTNLAKNIDIKQLTNQQTKVLDQMKAWKGNFQMDSTEGTLYARWIYYFLKNTFEDELGEALFGQFLATHLHKRLIAPMADNPHSVWWDDINTSDNKESQQQIIQKSFDQALESLEIDFGPDMDNWTWNKVHTLEHEHPIGKVKLLRSFFNVGPFEVAGTREVINNMAFSYDGDGFYQVRSGPSTRRIIDFSDVENSVSILPTGQSGNPFSEHYRDQSDLYTKGAFRKMMMNEKEIKTTSKSVLVFIP